MTVKKNLNFLFSEEKKMWACWGAGLYVLTKTMWFADYTWVYIIVPSMPFEALFTQGLRGQYFGKELV